MTKPLHITVRLNGEVTQDDTTAQHDQILRRSDRLCQHLHDAKAGDIIVTGTPVKSGPFTDPPHWLKAGDVVEVSWPELGMLRNPVVDEA